MGNYIWRFAGNNYGPEYGLETSDMEMFKKDPIASLARETCQNSIDARKDFTKPVTVEFNSFRINRTEIPGIEDLGLEIKNCLVYKKENPILHGQLKHMLMAITQSQIECLRVSDFNTKGLAGVFEHKNSPFYLLTKGSGLTDKAGTAGGSKGIGKFASFVASSFHTVFYSTINEEQQTGYIGISKLCSRQMENSDEKTLGTGYFCSNEKSSPIPNPIYIDPSFRDRTESGTDIYILGFRKESNWKAKIISKILESFMAAIIYGDLEVLVDGTLLSKNSLKKIIEEGTFLEKSLKNNISAQFYLLTDGKVIKETFEVNGYGKVDLYLTGYSRETVHKAINECIMVRYPFMKIKSFKNLSAVPFSAMCIIQKDLLNEMLRAIENPEHNDWQVNRINDESERYEVKQTINNLRKKIIEVIESHLTTALQDQTDLEGASQYLPDSELGDGQGKDEYVIDKPVITKPTRKRVTFPTAIEPNDDGNVVIDDVGGIVPSSGGDFPDGGGGGGGGGGDGTPKEEGDLVDGEEKISNYEQLSGIKYRFIVTHQQNGEYLLSFVSPYSETNCILSIFSLDDGNQKYLIEIKQAIVNEKNCELKDSNTVKLSLENGKKYSIKLKTNQFELFACEVKLYAYR
jgi:hypothetical protein